MEDVEDTSVVGALRDCDVLPNNLRARGCLRRLLGGEVDLLALELLAHRLRRSRLVVQTQNGLEHVVATGSAEGVESHDLCAGSGSLAKLVAR